MEDKLILFKDKKLLKLISNQQWHETIEYVNGEIENNQNLAPAYFIKGLALQYIDYLDEAKECNQKAYDIMENLLNDFVKSDNLVEIVFYCYHLISLKDYDHIIGICKPLGEKNQNYLPIIFLLAESYYKIEDFQRACDFNDMILQLNGTSLLGLLGKGKCLYKMKNYDQALIHYKLGFQNHPLQKQPYFQTCKVLEKQNKFQQSILFYDLLYKIDSEDKIINYKRGNALKEVDDFECAIICYEKAIELDKQYQKAYIQKADALAKLGKTEEALQILENILKSNPNNCDALFEKGNILTIMNQVKQAKVCFNQILKINQDFYKANLQLGKMIINKIKKKSSFSTTAMIKGLSHFDQVLQSCPDEIQGYLLKCQLLKECNQFYEAFELLKQAEPMSPNHLKILNLKCKFLGQQQHFYEALDIADQIIQLYPNNYQGYLRKSQILNSLQMFPDALICIEKAFSLCSIQPIMLFTKGILLNNLGHVDEALNYYDKAIKLKPGYFQAHLQKCINQSLSKAKSLINIGQLDAALQELNNLPIEKQSRPNIYCLRARILFYQGDIDAAKICIEEALYIDNHCEEAIQLKKTLEEKGFIS